MNSPRAYLFDYGGTLDTGGCHWGRVLWRAWQLAGVPVGEAAFREAYVFAERTLGRGGIIGPKDTFRQTLDVKLRLEMEHAGCMDWHDVVLEAVYEQTRRHTAHSVEVLTKLAERCPLGLVTNFYGNMHTVLCEFGFDGLFRSVTESAVAGVRKPDPEIFLMGVASMGLSPAEVTVVGDSIENDIKPACEAGCQTVWLRGEQWTDKPVDERIPHQVITDLNELL